MLLRSKHEHRDSNPIRLFWRQRPLPGGYSCKLEARCKQGVASANMMITLTNRPLSLGRRTRTSGLTVPNRPLCQTELHLDMCQCRNLFLSASMTRSSHSRYASSASIWSLSLSISLSVSSLSCLRRLHSSSSASHCSSVKMDMCLFPYRYYTRYSQ